jgi:hypothetical protein
MLPGTHNAESSAVLRNDASGNYFDDCRFAILFLLREQKCSYGLPVGMFSLRKHNSKDNWTRIFTDERVGRVSIARMGCLWPASLPEFRGKAPLRYLACNCEQERFPAELGQRSRSAKRWPMRAIEIRPTRSQKGANPWKSASSMRFPIISLILGLNNYEISCRCFPSTPMTGTMRPDRSPFARRAEVCSQVVCGRPALSQPDQLWQRRGFIFPIWKTHDRAEVSTFPRFLPDLYRLWQAVKDPEINRQCSLAKKLQ